MNISQLLRGGVSSSSSQPVDAKTLEMKVGQVVKGIVLQLLADQDAMVNIGGVPIRARLETPLQVGQMTLLQVQPESSSGQVVLKPLGSSNVQILEASLPDLFKSLGMKDTEANRGLIQQLHAAAIPINTKTIKQFQLSNQMTQAANIPLDQWTEAAIVAYKKGLPLKSEIVLPLQQAMFGKALPQSLEQLQSSLHKVLQAVPPQEENSDTMVLVRKLIDTINSLSSGRISSTFDSLEQEGNPSQKPANLLQTDAKQVSRAVINENMMNSSKQATGIAPIVTTAPTSSAPTSNQTTTQTNSQTNTQANTQTITQQAVVSASSSLTAGASATVQSAVAPIHLATEQQFPALPINTMTAGKSELSEQAARMQSMQSPSLEQPAQGAILQAVNDNNLGDQGDSWIKQLLKQLGIDHEHRTANLLSPSADMPDMEELQFRHESVKGLLLQLANSDQLPQSLKDAAQQVVQQITGQQLLLGAERGSPFSLVTLFVPIQHENGTDTASVHIQSKRKQGGNLDVDNCRLLFDLRMATLGDTLVDVQVVNRIVSLQVHNDFPIIGHLLDSLKPEIEAAMNRIGFQFISLKNLAYPDTSAGGSGEASSANDSRSSVSTTYHSKPYKGVDFRI